MMSPAITVFTVRISLLCVRCCHGDLLITIATELDTNVQAICWSGDGALIGVVSKV